LAFPNLAALLSRLASRQRFVVLIIGPANAIDGEATIPLS
jgi:hypothetical protein